MSGGIKVAPKLPEADRELMLCELCPRMCRHACPVGVVARDEALTASEKMAEARRQIRGVSTPGTHTAWDCTGCGLCTATCKHENPVGELLFAARAERFAAGDAPEGARALAKRCREEGGPHGEANRKALETIASERRIRSTVADFEGPRVPGRGVRVLFPGCDLRENPERVAALLEIADLLGEGDLALWDGAAPCCGYPLLAAGDTLGFEAHARRLAEALSGATLVTTSCAHCAWTLKVGWARVGIETTFEVEHFSQTASQALRRTRSTPPLKGEYVLHEPCYLAHGLKETGAPRKILNGILGAFGPDEGPEDDEGSGPPALPPSIWQGDRSWCCGGGGALPETKPELAREMARVRAADLLGTSFGVPGLPDSAGDSGDQKVVTASPCC